MAYAAIANGGTMWTPRLVERVAPPEDHRVSVSPEQLALAREALDATVNEEYGSAYEARSARVRIAGKMGHGQLDARIGEETDVWFAGYAPADDPQIAIVVLLERERHPSFLARRIVEEYLDPR